MTIPVLILMAAPMASKRFTRTPSIELTPPDGLPFTVDDSCGAFLTTDGEGGCEVLIDVPGAWSYTWKGIESHESLHGTFFADVQDGVIVVR